MAISLWVASPKNNLSKFVQDFARLGAGLEPKGSRLLTRPPSMPPPASVAAPLRGSRLNSNVHSAPVCQRAVARPALASLVGSVDQFVENGLAAGAGHALFQRHWVTAEFMGSPGRRLDTELKNYRKQ
jgi:hypothetical protein